MYDPNQPSNLTTLPVVTTKIYPIYSVGSLTGYTIPSGIKDRNTYREYNRQGIIKIANGLTPYVAPTSPAYTPSQAVVTPEVTNTTSPATTVATSPTTVGEQLGLLKGMYQAFKDGGTKAAAQYGLNTVAKNVGEAAATTKANFKAQSFGEKFNTVGSTIGSIMNALNARKELKLTRQALAHQMAMDNKNYEMARKQWNHALEEKARYREAMAKDQGRSYETVSEVMAKYGA